MSELTKMTIASALEALKGKEISATELVAAHIEQVEKNKPR